ncbi:MAG TPA: YihA family ribosome biogenesis GTP-binding protein [Acidobacteria bacterium]|nr:YihA family ribosome biogenesis GTP-binding protein [Acidobacteriota bacterium]
MEIRDVTFQRSALKAKDRPKEHLPHLAVAGRSNVGKSSLLNWLTRRQIARVAKAPGKTRMLNFFLVNGSFYLVDLPGYGYAKVRKDLQRQWGEELARYLLTDERIAGVIALIDIRHGPTRLDLEFQQFLLDAGRERLVVLTKADKVNRSKRKSMQREVQFQLGLPRPPVITSVEAGEGRRELLERMNELLDLWKTAHRGE